jgi:3-methyladenine DNA glycosylase Tag
MSNAGVIALKPLQGPASAITDDVLIGKDILDLLTGAMYVDPLSIYREYVQNAADAIEEAREAKLYSKVLQPAVRINIDPKARTIRIRDNGVGIAQKEFVKRLTALGASKKRGTNLRGFRGVGRLSGLGYCQELVFRARAAGDRKVSELSWDGKRLKEVLRSEDDTDLAQAIKAIAQTRTLMVDSYPEHFFEVELRGVRRVQNDILLNQDLIAQYLSQVAPVPFADDFRFAQTIEEFLNRYTKCETIEIRFGDNAPIVRPHQNSFPITDKVSDTFSGIQLFEVPSVEEGIDAAGWILTHSYLGAIPKRAQIAGLRARVGNMQIGTSDIYEGLFPQPRFNSWSVGEIHIVSKKIIPNGRRDDFEVNGHLQNLQSHVAKHTKDLVKVCRDKSVIRNRLKSAALLAETVSQSIALLEKSQFSDLKRHLSAYSERLVSQLEALANSQLLTNGERSFIHERSRTLSARLKRAAGSSRRANDAFSRIAPVKRKAFEEAIDAVLSTSLPISVRADLAQRILRRATAK